MTHPYEQLTPDFGLDALASVGLLGDGRLMALSSYENRVYQIHLEDGTQVVAKFYRPGRWSDEQIAEEHAFSQELTQAEIPVVAPLVLNGKTVHHFEGFSFSVCPKRGGRRPELDDFDVLEWIGRFLGRIHTVGAQKPFMHRPALNVQTFGFDSRDALLNGGYLPMDVESTWASTCNQALQAVQAAFDEFNDLQLLRLHGDCHPGNILWTPEGMEGAGPHFVDLDDARTGPAVQDLWMLVGGGTKAQSAMQLSALVDGYQEFREFDHRELALIEPLRTLRLIHYSTWLAQRWKDPIFPINFPWFGTSDYWRGQVRMLEEQMEAIAESS